jgi:hypothetical protein
VFLGHASTALANFKLVIVFVKVKLLTITATLTISDVHSVAAHLHALVVVAMETNGVVIFVQNPLLTTGGATLLYFSSPVTVLGAPFSLTLFCSDVEKVF